MMPWVPSRQDRAVAKPGIALAWGARGPEFKSRQPDQIPQRVTDLRPLVRPLFGVQLESKMDSGRVHAVDPIRRRRQIHHTMCTAPLLHQRRELCSCAAAEPPHRRRGTCQRGSRITGCQWAPYFSLGYSFSFNSDNGNKSRRRNLWVTDTLQWRPRARLAQPANPMRDSAASAFCSS